MIPLAPRPFGTTGLSVSPLGLGAGEIGDPALDDREVEALLRAAVELGVTLIDTARSYGRSEERIGRFLAPVRDQVVLSTKVGYGVDGVPDWTGECIRRGAIIPRRPLPNAPRRFAGRPAGHEAEFDVPRSAQTHFCRARRRSCGLPICRSATRLAAFRADKSASLCPSPEATERRATGPAMPVGRRS